ncbi:TRAP transporter small permease [Candidatus Puniceispirillum sp.]|jgi:TRAP-type C4-dicarboxylate transport system permease small subunit|uniref:TRAP transporter small permease n=1 Tax=Candidatus Puniceispirillum sp. TaxID=2026719 RepID=UPI001EC7FA85|nr:TRAP transporter small permease [Candidatus Puniceispirillum sp.]
MTNWPLLLGLPLWFWLFILPAIAALICRLTRFRIQPVLIPIWRLLDRVYLVSGVIAAIFMIMILLVIIAQMSARWLNIPFEGSTEFAGYAMAATSFFALAHALSRGAHIRVSILLNLNRYTRLWLDAFAMLIAAITATYFARFAVKTNFMSEILNDRTQGQDQIPEWILTLLKMPGTFPSEWAALWANSSSELIFTPVWVPQIPMSLGTILLAVALWDHLIRLLVTSETAIKGEVVE